MILGGRLGYVLFYQPAFFAANPGQILAVWQGGMSFHGGFLGVVAGVIGFSLKNRLAILGVGDAVAAAAPIGLFFGRIANFINGELWGRPSTAPWAVIFPGEAAQSCPADWVGPCARHPSQLYEAGLEGLLLFVILALAIRGRGAGAAGPGLRHLPRRLRAGAGLLEDFRQADAQFVTPDNPHGHVLSGLTMGQLLSLPMLAVGLVLIARSARRGLTGLGAPIRALIARRGAAHGSTPTWRSACGTITRPAIPWARPATSSPRRRSARCSAS